MKSFGNLSSTDEVALEEGLLGIEADYTIITMGIDSEEAIEEEEDEFEEADD